MKDIIIPYTKIPWLTKISLCFTWDDNSPRHADIAKLFQQFGFNCTFFVVPGDADFGAGFSGMYRKLARAGFEIGSHSMNHGHFNSMSVDEAKTDIGHAHTQIRKQIGIAPFSFAFPYHETNRALLGYLYTVHGAVRNELPNANIIDLKSKSSFNFLVGLCRQAVSENRNLVLVGHSVIYDRERNDGNPRAGYEPVLFEKLMAFLETVKTSFGMIDVIDIQQAWCREIFRQNAKEGKRGLTITVPVYKQLLKLGLKELQEIEVEHKCF